jgi:hypothetical protein
MNRNELEMDIRASRTSLPAAAQRWLERALPRDLDPPATITLEQEGSMEMRGQWTPLKAKGVYTAAPLAFNWRARLQILPGVWIEADDGHKDGRGWGGARLWGVIPMGSRDDPEVLMTQMVRNLAELPWLPAFALIEPGLRWSDAGEGAFEVRADAGAREATVRFEMDDEGDVVRASSPARPYDVPGGYAEAPWFYTFGDHREFGGVRVPGSAVATFDKSEGAWEYLRVRVTAVR